MERASMPAPSHPRLPSYGGGAAESAVVLRLPSISVSSSSATSATSRAFNWKANEDAARRRALVSDDKIIDVLVTLLGTCHVSYLCVR